MSQQLLQLNSELAATTDISLRAEIMSRRAIVLARFGKFSEARLDVKSLRHLHGDWRSGTIHVWIMLAEALIDWFSDLNPNALDRLTRVQVLSSAMKYADVLAISSAWKGHVQFEMSDFDGMLRSLQLSMQSATERNSTANARIAVVLCSALSLCGAVESAQIWFRRGRMYALAEGDTASIEALQYNRAALAITRLRADSCFGELEASHIRVARIELNSAKNLQLLIQSSALENHLHLCEARLMILEAAFVEAISKFESTRKERPFAAYHFSQLIIDLEVAYCYFRLGRGDEAISRFSVMSLALLSELDLDDQLQAARMCHEMAASDPRFGDPHEIERRRFELGAAYKSADSALQASLHTFLMTAPTPAKC